MPHRPTARDLGSLFDMLEAAKVISNRLVGDSAQRMREDLALRDAVLYRFVIIGEAARRLSEDVKSQIPLPWPRITGMRNVLVHNYDEIDLETVTRAVEQSLPELIDALDTYLRRYPPE